MKRKIQIVKATASVGVSALIISLTGCGSSVEAAPVDGSWEEVVEAAVEEGEVSLYSVGPSAQNDRIEAAFTEAYPEIDIQVLKGAGELASRVEAEVQSGSKGVDVFLFSDPQWFVENEDMLAEINVPSEEGWHEERWLDEGKSFVPTAYPYSMIAWNTDLLPEGIQDWEDLLQPSLKGSIGLRSDFSTPTLAGYHDFLEAQLGADFLEGLGEQRPTFYTSGVPMTQSVASGEIAATYNTSPSIVHELKQQGAPVESLVPDPSYWIEWGGGALAGSSNPNAAQVLVDFLMSEEGQLAINGEGFGRASRDGIEGALEATDALVFDSTQYSVDDIAEIDAKSSQWLQ